MLDLCRQAPPIEASLMIITALPEGLLSEFASINNEIEIITLRRYNFFERTSMLYVYGNIQKKIRYIQGAETPDREFVTRPVHERK